MQFSKRSSCRRFFSLIVLAMFISCEQKSAENDLTNSSKRDNPIAAGVINTGPNAGSQFVLYDGKEVVYMKEMIRHYNNLQADSIDYYSADSVQMYTTDGKIIYSKAGDMGAYFATLDSVEWIVDAMIPLKVQGEENEVRIMLDTREIGYPKQGEPYKVSLMEEFTFKNGKMVGIRQWSKPLF